MKVNIFIVLTLFITITFLSCTSNPEKLIDDPFFVPVEKIERPKQSNNSLPIIITRTRRGEQVVDQSTKTIIVDMILEQNKQLNVIQQEMLSLMNNYTVDTLLFAESNSDLTDTLKQTTGNQLLDIIKNQNIKLDNIVKQINVYSKYQQQIKEQLLKNAELQNSKQIANAELYGKAIEIYNNQQYKRAISEFNKLILDEKTDSSLIDNCIFWKGVSYFHLNKPYLAINEFQKVIKISNSDKIESAYFMIGQCYEYLGDNSYAVNIFNKMLRKYPNGNFSQIADIKIALLK